MIILPGATDLQRSIPKTNAYSAPAEGAGDPAPSEIPLVDSVQEIEVTVANSTTGTGTITPVDTSRTAIFNAGYTAVDTTDNSRRCFHGWELTSATQITGYKAWSSGNVYLQLWAVEFNSDAVRSVTADTYTWGVDMSVWATTHTSSTYTGVDPAYSVVLWQGCTCNDTAESPEIAHSYYKIVDAGSGNSTVQMERNSAGKYGAMFYSVIEFEPDVIEHIEFAEVTVSAATTTHTLSQTVDTANTMIIFQGYECRTSTLPPDRQFVGLEITDGDTITLTRQENVGTMGVRFSVVEFVDGVINNRQSFKTTVDTASAETETITSVDTSKSFINFTGKQVTATSKDRSQYYQDASAVLTNATTVTVDKAADNGSEGDPILHYDVIEST